MIGIMMSVVHIHRFWFQAWKTLCAWLLFHRVYSWGNCLYWPINQNPGLHV